MVIAMKEVDDFFAGFVFGFPVKQEPVRQVFKKSPEKDSTGQQQADIGRGKT